MIWLRFITGKLFLIKFALRILTVKSAARFLLFAIRKFIFKEKIPALAILAVTYECQCSCPHCSADTHRKSLSGALDTNECKKVINEIHRLGVPRIYFSGGEPLLRKDIFELVAYASKKGFLIFIETNGLNLDYEAVIKLKHSGVSCVSVSVDSADASAHDLLRGVSGIFQNAIDGINICREQKVNVIISTYASKRALYSGDLCKIIKLAKTLKLPAIRVLPPYLSGKWLKSDNEKLGMSEENLVNRLMPASLPFIGGRLKPRVCPINRRHIVFIGPSGMVQPCAHLPFSFGNVKEKNLAHIIEQMAADKMFSGAKTCFINNYDFRKRYILNIKEDEKLPIAANNFRKPFFIVTLDLEADHGLNGQKDYDALKFMRDLTAFFKQRAIPLTIFSTGKILEDRHDEIKKIVGEGGDIQLHSYDHACRKDCHFFRRLNLVKSAYRKLCGDSPIGYRPPYGKIRKRCLGLIKQEGFKYISSLSLHGLSLEPLKCAGLTYGYNDGIYNFPITRIPWFNIPMGLSWMNFFGVFLFRKLYKPILKNRQPVIFYLHLHDLYNTKAYDTLPFYWKIFYIRNRLTNRGYGNLDSVINDFRSNGYYFCSMLDLYKHLTKN